MFKFTYFCNPETNKSNCEKKSSCGRNINNYRAEDYENQEVNYIYKCIDHIFYFPLEHENQVLETNKK